MVCSKGWQTTTRAAFGVPKRACRTGHRVVSEDKQGGDTKSYRLGRLLLQVAHVFTATRVGANAAPIYLQTTAGQVIHAMGSFSA